MLYRANKTTKRICLRLKMEGCCNDMALHISPLQCEEPPEKCYVYTPCGGLETVEKVSEPPLTLVYDMFDRSESNDVCFLLDSQFAELACGRYIAKVIACGCTISEFQIDKRDTARLSKVLTDNRSNCCEGKYGC